MTFGSADGTMLRSSWARVGLVAVLLLPTSRALVWTQSEFSSGGTGLHTVWGEVELCTSHIATVPGAFTLRSFSSYEAVV